METGTIVGSVVAIVATSLVVCVGISVLILAIMLWKQKLPSFRTQHSKCRQFCICCSDLEEDNVTETPKVQQNNSRRKVGLTISLPIVDETQLDDPGYRNTFALATNLHMRNLSPKLLEDSTSEQLLRQEDALAENQRNTYYENFEVVRIVTRQLSNNTQSNMQKFPSNYAQVDYSEMPQATACGDYHEPTEIGLLQKSRFSCKNQSVSQPTSENCDDGDPTTTLPANAHSGDNYCEIQLESLGDFGTNGHSDDVTCREKLPPSEDYGPPYSPAAYLEPVSYRELHMRSVQTDGSDYATLTAAYDFGEDGRFEPVHLSSPSDDDDDATAEANYATLVSSCEGNIVNLNRGRFDIPVSIPDAGSTQNRDSQMVKSVRESGFAALQKNGVSDDGDFWGLGADV